MKSWIQTRLLRLYILLLYSEDQKRLILPTFIVVALSTLSVLFNPTNFLLLIDYFC